MGLLEEAWRNLVVRARGVFVLREKLKGLKACLKEWNHNHFGNIHNNIVKIEKEMNELNKKEESVGLSLVELEIRRGCKKNFEEMSYIKSLFSNKSQDSSDIEKDIAIQSSFTL